MVDRDPVRRPRSAAPLQRALTDRAIAALANTVERHEVERVEPPHDSRPIACIWKGATISIRRRLAEIRRARRLFRDASKLDPGLRRPVAGCARTLTMEWILRGAPDRALLDEAVSAADQAIATDVAGCPRPPRTRLCAALPEASRRKPGAVQRGGDAEPATTPISSPTTPTPWPMSGDPATAATVLDRALSLNPSPPRFYRWVQASIHYQTGRYARRSRRWRHFGAIRQLPGCWRRATRNPARRRRRSNLLRIARPEFAGSPSRALMGHRAESIRIRYAPSDRRPSQGGHTVSRREIGDGLSRLYHGTPSRVRSAAPDHPGSTQLLEVAMANYHLIGSSSDDELRLENLAEGTVCAVPREVWEEVVSMFQAGDAETRRMAAGGHARGSRDRARTRGGPCGSPSRATTSPTCW